MKTIAITFSLPPRICLIAGPARAVLDVERAQLLRLEQSPPPLLVAACAARARADAAARGWMLRRAEDGGVR